MFHITSILKDEDKSIAFSLVIILFHLFFFRNNKNKIHSTKKIHTQNKQKNYALQIHIFPPLQCRHLSL
jgi:uncharacterized membrane protein